MTQEQIFMLEAIRAARQSVVTHQGGPFGAVVVFKGEIVGKSGNQVFATNDPTAHAEIMAIREASKKLGTAELTGCEMYSVGEPCPMCLAAIYWSRIATVYYANTKEQAAQIGFDDTFIYRELRSDITDRVLPMLHQPHADGIELFASWDQDVDKSGLPQT